MKYENRCMCIFKYESTRTANRNYLPCALPWAKKRAKWKVARSAVTCHKQGGTYASTSVFLPLPAFWFLRTWPHPKSSSPIPIPNTTATKRPDVAHGRKGYAAPQYVFFNFKAALCKVALKYDARPHLIFGYKGELFQFKHNMVLAGPRN